MAASKTLNTRIQLKYDTYANWTTNNPVLLKGELALVEVPAESGSGMQEPAYLLKMGDGTSQFSALTWVGGIAADVYPWAKAQTKPTYTASEISGLSDFISGEIEDTDTQYQIVKNGNMGFKLQSKAKDGVSWTDVNTIDLVAPTYSALEGSTNGTIKFGVTGSEQEVSVHGLGSAAFTESGAYDTNGAAATVKTELIGTDGDLSTANTIKGAKKYSDEKIAESASGMTLAEVTASQGQIINTISQSNGKVTATTRAITKEDIPTIEQSQVNGLNASLAAKQDTLVFNTPYDASSNKAATMADVANSIEGLSGAMHYIGESTTDPSTGTVTIDGEPEYEAISGDVVTYQKKEYVYDGASWRELGDESSFAIKGSIKDADIAADANIAQSKIAGLEAALAGKATSADITEAINALDVADSEVANQVVTGVSQTDGKITVTRRGLSANDIPEIGQDKVTGLTAALAGKADTSVTDGLDGRIDVLEGTVDGLSNIATTGNVNDLIQTESEYLVFNCGSSTINI